VATPVSRWRSDTTRSEEERRLCTWHPHEATPSSYGFCWIMGQIAHCDRFARCPVITCVFCDSFGSNNQYLRIE